MSDNRDLPGAKALDIFAKRVLGKKTLFNYQEVYQEKYGLIPGSNPPANGPLGVKIPLKIYVINHNSTAAVQPIEGSPVKCVKLCKRIFDPGYPLNTLICTSKSRITIRFQLIMLVEYMDGTFTMLNLPNDLNAQTNYINNTTTLPFYTTKGFLDQTVIQPVYTVTPPAGTTPGSVAVSENFIVQNQNQQKPYETLVIKKVTTTDAQGNAVTQSWFEYSVTIPFTDFEPNLRHCELEDPTLESHILLKNRKSDFDVLNSVLIPATVTYSATVTGNVSINNYIYATEVDFSLYEDIIDKLGIDQDINIEGVPENECVDNC
ncbi:MAG TPA: hypothetical protein VF941_06735 [Clostridia bacterium]